MFPDGETSELPWSIKYNAERRKLVVKGAKKKIADKDFPRTYSDEMVKEIVDTIEKGIEVINKNS